MKKRNVDIDNFIGVFDGYFSDEMIDSFLQIYKDHEYRNDIYKRADYHTDDPTLVKDQSVPDFQFNETQTWINRVPGFLENFNMAVKKYEKEYGLQTIVGYKTLRYNPIKLQKTKPGEGYHVWHIEGGGSFNHIKRVLAFTVYLNDVSEGGETEFLYQHKRIKPEKGKLIIWPANFPFVHRGNPPLNQEKYILTSWLSAEYPDL